MMRTHCPLSTSHTRRVPSSLLLSRLLLSGVKAIAYTAAVCPCSAVRELARSTSQSQIVSSKPQLATVRPSGLQATARTRSVCSVNVWRTRPLATSQSLTVRSKLPLASCVPSGAKASPNPKLVCPASVCTHMPDCAPCICHNRMRPSKPPLASRLPSGLQATVYTGLGGPSSICRFVPDVASQSPTIVPSPPLASMRPSGAKARLWMLSVCQLVQSRVTCSPDRVPRSRSHTLMLHAAQDQARQIEATQVPSQHAQQRHQIGRSIPLPVLGPVAHLIEQGAQPLLHRDVPLRRALEADQQGPHEQPLLGLPHIFL